MHREKVGLSLLAWFRWRSGSRSLSVGLPRCRCVNLFALSLIDSLSAIRDQMMCGRLRWIEHEAGDHRTDTHVPHFMSVSPILDRDVRLARTVGLRPSVSDPEYVCGPRWTHENPYLFTSQPGDLMSYVMLYNLSGLYLPEPHRRYRRGNVECPPEQLCSTDAAAPCSRSTTYRAARAGERFPAFETIALMPR